MIPHTTQTAILQVYLKPSSLVHLAASFQLPRVLHHQLECICHRGLAIYHLFWFLFLFALLLGGELFVHHREELSRLMS